MRVGAATGTTLTGGPGKTADATDGAAVGVATAAGAGASSATLTSLRAATADTPDRPTT
jgi:hypothetical protein